MRKPPNLLMGKPVKYILIITHGGIELDNKCTVPDNVAVMDLAENDYRGTIVSTNLLQLLLNVIYGDSFRNIRPTFNAMVGGRMDEKSLLAQVAYRTPGDSMYNFNLLVNSAEPISPSMGCWDLTGSQAIFRSDDFLMQDPDGNILRPPYRRIPSVDKALSGGTTVKTVFELLKTQYPEHICFITLICCTDMDKNTKYTFDPASRSIAAFTHHPHPHISPEDLLLLVGHQSNRKEPMRGRHRGKYPFPHLNLLPLNEIPEETNETMKPRNVKTNATNE